MNARTAGVRQGLGGALYVERAAARQRGHLRPRKLAADGVNGFEIALRGDGKAGFQDVDPKLHQLAGHLQLLGNIHAAARRLLAVPQRGIENVYPITHVCCTGNSHYCEWGWI